MPADADRCNLYAPQFGADTAVLFNGTNQSTTVNAEMRVLDTLAALGPVAPRGTKGPLNSRTLRLGAQAARQLQGPALGLPPSTAGGSLKVGVAQTPTPTLGTTATARPALGASPEVPAPADSRPAGPGGFTDAAQFPDTGGQLGAGPPDMGSFTLIGRSAPQLDGLPAGGAPGSTIRPSGASATLILTPPTPSTTPSPVSASPTMTQTPRPPTLSSTQKPVVTASATQTQRPTPSLTPSPAVPTSATATPEKPIPTETPEPEDTPEPTPSPESTPPPGPVTAEPTSAPKESPTTRPVSTVACRLAAVVYSSGAASDGWAFEAFTDDDVGTDVFIPAVHRSDMGIDTDVVIQNVGAVDTRADITLRTDRGDTSEWSLTVRSGSAIAIDRRDIPRGVSSLQIAGTDGARFLAAAYHRGNAELAANLGTAHGASRIALPILFRAAGRENVYSSTVRVMKLDQGALQPRITFRDAESGERIGPILATRPNGTPRVLREGEGHTWYLTDMSELRDGRTYSAEVDSVMGGDLAVTVEEVNTIRGTLAAYTGVPIRGALPTVLTAPLVMKNLDGVNSSIQVQNLTGNHISATVRFFTLGGSHVATKTTGVRPRDSSTVYLPATSLPDGFVGRAEIIGSGGIAAVVSSVRYRSGE